MEHIGIRYNDAKVPLAKVESLTGWLEQNGRKVSIIGRRDATIPPGLDMLIVMGGDGTLLGGARMAAMQGIPVFGIDFGGLGFLSEIKFKDARASLKKIFNGDFRLEERLMLETRVKRGGSERKPIFAINDVVVTKNSGRMLRLKVFINGSYFHEFPGDGLIISTSTGSTAYALSAGGPIVSPELDVLVLTPICPHTLFARAIITSGSDDIRIELPADRKDMILIMDGQEEFPLRSGEVVDVRSAAARARYIRVTGPRFYGTVREKFKLT